MRRLLSVAPLTALAALLASSAASASEWHLVKDTGPALQAGNRRDVATSYLTRAAAELRLEGVSLAFNKELPSTSHSTVRFEQTHGGLPVMGATVAVRLDAAGKPRLVVSEVARGIAVDPTPSIDAVTAMLLAEEALGEPLAREPGVKLAIQPQKDGPGRLVYLVSVLQGSPRERVYIVDAHAGRAIRWYPTARHALGRVYPIGPSSGVQDLDLPDLVTSSPQRLTGWNGNLTVGSYQGGDPYYGTMTVQQSLAPSSGGNFLYDPPGDPLSLDDEFAEVNTYYHLTRARHFFMDNLGVDMSAQSWSVFAAANVIQPGNYMDNAFFSQEGIAGEPNLIAIGQGSSADFAIDSDVFIHEFGHYITHNAINYNGSQIAFSPQYGLSPWSGGIDEGISDYFACSINNNQILGEASLADYARDLSDTSKTCPDGVVGEVHEDGEIIGSLSWSVRQAFGPQIADQLVWGAISLLNQGSSLGDFAKGLQATADDLVGSGQLTSQNLQTLDTLIAQRGMDDCDHVLELAKNKSRTITMMGLEMFANLIGYTCGQVQGQLGTQSLFHFMIKPMPSDTSLRVTVDYQSFGGGNTDWGIHAQTTTPVSISDDTLLPIGATWTQEHVNGSTGELVIDANSTPPFDPTKTYYVVLSDESCAPARVTLSSNVGFIQPEPNPGTGGGGGEGGGTGEGGSGANSGSGGDDDTGSDGLCAYRAGTSGSLAGWAGLTAVGLAIAALRRARRSRRG